MIIQVIRNAIDETSNCEIPYLASFGKSGIPRRLVFDHMLLIVDMCQLLRDPFLFKVTIECPRVGCVRP
jgi:hypothetical protein